ncbi:MAG TPA: hypothetical protein VG329_10220 [Candidatus Dormibacteraeota bacterium]|nr:hypothetical protein [Candidatus Dormibacteraeota bacterium]
MTSEFQPSDRLKAILEQAKVRTAAQAAEYARTREADPTDLVNKDAALPDPRALARMYQSEDLRAKLTDVETPAAGEAHAQPPGWDALPAPAPRPGGGEAETLADERDATSRPSMTPAQMRAVMAELQETFQVSDRSYETYELSSRPLDDLPVISEEERERERAEAIAALSEGSGGIWPSLLGAGLVLVVVVIFVLLAINGVGPFKPAPTTVGSPSPQVTKSP